MDLTELVYEVLYFLDIKIINALINGRIKYKIHYIWRYEVWSKIAYLFYCV